MAKFRVLKVTPIMRGKIVITAKVIEGIVKENDYFTVEGNRYKKVCINEPIQVINSQDKYAKEGDQFLFQLSRSDSMINCNDILVLMDI